jgi:hypothetical protein
MTAPLSQGYYQRAGAGHDWALCAEVQLAHVVSSKRGRSLHDLLYIDAAGAEHLAAAGTETDGGSKPRWSWLLFGHPYDPRYLRAYVIHDAAVEAARRVYQMDVARGRALRLHADRTFREGVLWIGLQHAAQLPTKAKRRRARAAARARAASYYRAVRAGAWWEMGC